MSALPQTIQVMFDGSEQQAPVHLGAEHTLTQLNFSDNFVLKVLDFQFWHFDFQQRVPSSAKEEVR
jgi:hypothetical protein